MGNRKYGDHLYKRWANFRQITQRSLTQYKGRSIISTTVEANVDSGHYLTRITVTFTSWKIHQKKLTYQNSTQSKKKFNIKEEWEKEQANTQESFDKKKETGTDIFFNYIDLYPVKGKECLQDKRFLQEFAGKIHGYTPQYLYFRKQDGNYH